MWRGMKNPWRFFLHWRILICWTNISSSEKKNILISFTYILLTSSKKSFSIWQMTVRQMTAFPTGISFHSLVGQYFWFYPSIVIQWSISHRSGNQKVNKNHFLNTKYTRASWFHTTSLNQPKVFDIHTILRAAKADYFGTLIMQIEDLRFKI